MTLARGWELRLGDCLAEGSGVSSLPDRSVDVVITDPPYSEHIYRNTRTNRGRPDLRTPHDIDHARELASKAIGSIDAILPAVAAQLLRVARRWIVIFHDAEASGRWRDALGAAYVRAGAWVKTDPMPQISADRPAQGFEAITIAHPPGRKRWNGGGRAAVWIAGRCQGPGRPDHPCPKPVELMERLVRDFSDRGELILDPFAGSGTTGVAALRLGRRFLGWERSAKYHAVADRRLASAHEQLELAGFDRARPASDADHQDRDNEAERPS